MSKWLSIIIPVYKVESYVEQCLRSCAQQAGIPASDYEIIVINDGSPDHSPDICERVAGEFPNIRMVSQSNAGLSAARNKGLSLAQGDYIWFVDSDDWIEPACLQALFQRLKETDYPDILHLQGRIDYEDGRYDDDYYHYSFDGIIDGREQMRRGGFHTLAQWALYRRAFLEEHHLRFFQGIYHEDNEFKPRVCYLAKSIACLDSLCYHLRRGTSDSITSVFKLKNAMDILVVINRLYLFSKELPSADKVAFNRYISKTMNSLMVGTPQLSREDKKPLFKELRQHRYIFNLMRHSGNKKYYLEGLLLSVNINFAFALHRMFK